ncbi:SIMPL domain-containing protein [Flavobacterium johnsoniae]|uniref:SIMPL domain-containing protein n=1 Tax=Flavobacterium johnsoniae TaxID=986 RepID=UPI0025AF231A|nr:SIMPL domain-containing protein [Flavobacterium johnsoniae]WJS94833.1 SIMPL domain-containing protein [Flavobacterium johnsoniae]
MKHLFFALLAFITINSFSQTKISTDKPFIDVSGLADTLVVPNKIWINVLLSEKDSKGKKSVEDLENEMILKLKEIGINTEKDVSVNDMSSNFKNYIFKQNDIFKSKSYFILVKNASETAKVFIGLEKIGISNVRIDKIEHTDERKIKLLINGKAILNAKKTAESFTKPLNQKVGTALQITNNESISPSRAMMNEVVVVGYGKSKSSNDNNIEPSVEFEKIKISSFVQVRFLIE